MPSWLHGRRIAVLVAVAGLLLSLASLLFAAGVLVLAGGDFKTTSVDLYCPVPGTDSDYGSSTWRWLPPGRVCHYPDGSDSGINWSLTFLFGTAATGAAMLLFGLRRYAQSGEAALAGSHSDSPSN